MYLVVIEFRTGSAAAAAAASTVVPALIAAARPADGLEHVYVRAASGGVDLVLFLLATTAESAERTGRGLCARSVGMLAGSGHRWDLRVAVADVLADRAGPGQAVFPGISPS